MPSVMLSCGEASGDLYAAALVAALRARVPDLECCGFGGPRLAAAGARLVGGYEGLTVTGLVEALPVIRRGFHMRDALVQAARDRRPDVFIAIDFPDFNLRVLPAMQRLGVPIVYYIRPQFWAWRAGRLKTIRRYVDRMLVIFPFEQTLYEDAGVPVEFVGHPLIDLLAKTQPRETWLRSLGLDPAAPTVALLPGSRPSELGHILPTLVDAARLIRARVTNAQFVLARAPGLTSSDVAPFDALTAAGIPAAMVEGATDDALANSDVAITASGTATVQAALHERPMVVVYRLSPLTYAIGKWLVRVSTYGMVNLVAGRSVVPELIQHDFTPARVAAETIDLLTNHVRAAQMRADLREVRVKLGGGGASGRAAEAVLATMKRSLAG
jgi:lipid-A-disaccharide synthase